MSFFPITCVDNFYKDPDKVRELALSLEFKKPSGYYPGHRTERLHTVVPEFFNDFCMKLFALFYDYDVHLVDWTVETYFQKIEPFSKDKNAPINSGWIHLDEGYVFAGVIYLTPDADKNAGTTLYNLKDPKDKEILDYTLRNKLYAGEEVNIEEYEKVLTKHNDHYFEKTLEFKNVYNRMISYGGWHKENNFFASETEPRLTQVFFIHEVIADNTPIERTLMSNL